MQDLPQKLEAAIKAIVDADALGINVYTGQDNDTQELPKLVIHADQGDESPSGSGNFNMQVVCTLRGSADGELPAWRSLLSQVLGILMEDDMATQITNADSSITVLGIYNRASRTSIEGTAWEATFSFTAYCCNMALA